MQVRLQCWPTGGGKAHDTGLLCKWLDWELQRADQDSLVIQLHLHIILWCENVPLIVYTYVPKARRHQDLFAVLAWALSESNNFFHILYHEGIWLNLNTAKVAVKHGWAMCEA